MYSAGEEDLDFDMDLADDGFVDSEYAASSDDCPMNCVCFAVARAIRKCSKSPK